MATWTLQPQECAGTYRFSGKVYATRRVQDEINPFQVFTLYMQIRDLVEREDGLDYLQVFIDGQGRKLFFIDQLNDEMMASEDFEEQDNYCTLLFAEEY